MQLTPHATRQTPHGAPRLVQAMSAWSVKPQHAPSRHCRDARVYGHTTTTMHKIEYISPIEFTPPPPAHPCLLTAPSSPLTPQTTASAFFRTSLSLLALKGC